MTAIRFFTDEDVYGSVAPALRRAGRDALSTPDPDAWANPMSHSFSGRLLSGEWS
jgi:hypothetical protein